MACENYENDIPEDAATQGNTVEAYENDAVRLCPDGKYRWYYEFPMLKNPVILFTIWKVMLIAALFPALLVFFSELSDGFVRALTQFLIVYGIAFGGVFVLSCIGYLILAAVYGFKYIVLFEMDDKTITHAQQEKLYSKAQAVSWLAIASGVSRGDPGAVGTGMLAASKQKMTSEFKNVSTVIGLKKKNTIKVNQLFGKNQVYVRTEDYDLVWNHITSRCINAKIK